MSQPVSWEGQGGANGAADAADTSLVSVTGVGAAKPQAQLFHPGQDAGAVLIADALRALPLPIAPIAVSRLDGPVLEVRRVADSEEGAATALDIRVTAGFRAHFDPVAMAAAGGAAAAQGGLAPAGPGAGFQQLTQQGERRGSVYPGLSEMRSGSGMPSGSIGSGALNGNTFITDVTLEHASTAGLVHSTPTRVESEQGNGQLVGEGSDIQGQRQQQMQHQGQAQHPQSTLEQQHHQHQQPQQLPHSRHHHSQYHGHHHQPQIRGRFHVYEDSGPPSIAAAANNAAASHSHSLGGRGPNGYDTFTATDTPELHAGNTAQGQPAAGSDAPHVVLGPAAAAAAHAAPAFMEDPGFGSPVGMGAAAATAKPTVVPVAGHSPFAGLADTPWSLASVGPSHPDPRASMGPSGGSRPADLPAPAQQQSVGGGLAAALKGQGLGSSVGLGSGVLRGLVAQGAAGAAAAAAAAHTPPPAADTLPAHANAHVILSPGIAPSGGEWDGQPGRKRRSLERPEGGGHHARPPVGMGGQVGPAHPSSTPRVEYPSDDEVMREVSEAPGNTMWGSRMMSGAGADRRSGAMHPMGGGGHVNGGHGGGWGGGAGMGLAGEVLSPSLPTTSALARNAGAGHTGDAHVHLNAPDAGVRAIDQANRMGTALMPAPQRSPTTSTAGHSEWELDGTKLQLGRRIAVGGFAEVYVGRYEGTLVAVKKLFATDEDTIRRFAHEVRLLARLRHPNLILFMGYTLRPEPSIVSEFMGRGSLFHLMRARGGEPLEPRAARAVAVAVARGMAYLHSRNPPILHLDLKSPNILVDGAWRIKIADFGLSTVRQHTFVSSGNAGGTPEWMAPEVLRCERYDEKADVFSYGVVLWEVLTGQVPWQDLNPMQVVGAVGFSRRSLPAPTRGDPFLVSLCTSCMAQEPSHRPSFPQIVSTLDAHFGPPSWADVEGMGGGTGPARAPLQLLPPPQTNGAHANCGRGGEAQAGGVLTLAGAGGSGDVAMQSMPSGGVVSQRGLGPTAMVVEEVVSSGAASPAQPSSAAAAHVGQLGQHAASVMPAPHASGQHGAVGHASGRLMGAHSGVARVSSGGGHMDVDEEHGGMHMQQEANTPASHLLSAQPSADVSSPAHAVSMVISQVGAGNSAGMESATGNISAGGAHGAVGLQLAIEPQGNDAGQQLHRQPASPGAVMEAYESWGSAAGVAVQQLVPEALQTCTRRGGSGDVNTPASPTAMSASDGGKGISYDPTTSQPGMGSQARDGPMPQQQQQPQQQSPAVKPGSLESLPQPPLPPTPTSAPPAHVPRANAVGGGLINGVTAPSTTSPPAPASTDGTATPAPGSPPAGRGSSPLSLMVPSMDESPAGSRRRGRSPFEHRDATEDPGPPSVTAKIDDAGRRVASPRLPLLSRIQSQREERPLGRSSAPARTSSTSLLDGPLGQPARYSANGAAHADSPEPGPSSSDGQLQRLAAAYESRTLHHGQPSTPLAAGAGQLALAGTHAPPFSHPISSPALQGSPSPVQHTQQPPTNSTVAHAPGWPQPRQRARRTPSFYSPRRGGAQAVVVPVSDASHAAHASTYPQVGPHGELDGALVSDTSGLAHPNPHQQHHHHHHHHHQAQQGLSQQPAAAAPAGATSPSAGAGAGAAAAAAGTTSISFSGHLSDSSPFASQPVQAAQVAALTSVPPASPAVRSSRGLPPTHGGRPTHVLVEGLQAGISGQQRARATGLAAGITAGEGSVGLTMGPRHYSLGSGGPDGTNALPAAEDLVPPLAGDTAVEPPPDARQPQSPKAGGAAGGAGPAGGRPGSSAMQPSVVALRALRRGQHRRVVSDDWGAAAGARMWAVPEHSELALPHHHPQATVTGVPIREGEVLSIPSGAPGGGTLDVPSPFSMFGGMLRAGAIEIPRNRILQLLDSEGVETVGSAFTEVSLGWGVASMSSLPSSASVGAGGAPSLAAFAAAGGGGSGAGGASGSSAGHTQDNSTAVTRASSAAPHSSGYFVVGELEEEAAAAEAAEAAALAQGSSGGLPSPTRHSLGHVQYPLPPYPYALGAQHPEGPHVPLHGALPAHMTGSGGGDDPMVVGSLDWPGAGVMREQMVARFGHGQHAHSHLQPAHGGEAHHALQPHSTSEHAGRAPQAMEVADAATGCALAAAAMDGRHARQASLEFMPLPGPEGYPGDVLGGTSPFALLSSHPFTPSPSTTASAGRGSLPSTVRGNATDANFAGFSPVATPTRSHLDMRSSGSGGGSGSGSGLPPGAAPQHPAPQPWRMHHLHTEHASQQQWQGDISYAAVTAGGMTGGGGDAHSVHHHGSPQLPALVELAEPVVPEPHEVHTPGRPLGNSTPGSAGPSKGALTPGGGSGSPDVADLGGVTQAMAVANATGAKVYRSGRFKVTDLKLAAAAMPGHGSGGLANNSRGSSVAGSPTISPTPSGHVASLPIPERRASAGGTCGTGEASRSMSQLLMAYDQDLNGPHASDRQPGPAAPLQIRGPLGTSRPTLEGRPGSGHVGMDTPIGSMGGMGTGASLGTSAHSSLQGSGLLDGVMRQERGGGGEEAAVLAAAARKAAAATTTMYRKGRFFVSSSLHSTPDPEDLALSSAAAHEEGGVASDGGGSMALDHAGNSGSPSGLGLRNSKSSPTLSMLLVQQRRSSGGGNGGGGSCMMDVEGSCTPTPAVSMMGGAGSPWGAPEMVAAVAAATGQFSGGPLACAGGRPLGKPPLPQPPSRRSTRDGTLTPDASELAAAASAHLQQQPSHHTLHEHHQPHRSITFPSAAHTADEHQRPAAHAIGGSGSLGGGQPRHYQRGRFEVLEEGEPAPPAPVSIQGSGGSMGGAWASGVLSTSPSMLAAAQATGLDPQPSAAPKQAPGGPHIQPQASILHGQPSNLQSQGSALQPQGSGLPPHGSVPQPQNSVASTQGRSMRLGRFIVRVDESATQVCPIDSPPKCPLTRTGDMPLSAPPSAQLPAVAVGTGSGVLPSCSSMQVDGAESGGVTPTGGPSTGGTGAEQPRMHRSFRRVQSRGRFMVTEESTTPLEALMPLPLDQQGFLLPMAGSPPPLLLPVPEHGPGILPQLPLLPIAAAVPPAAVAQQQPQQQQQGLPDVAAVPGPSAAHAVLAAADAAAAQHALQQFHDDVASMLQSAAAAQEAGAWGRRQGSSDEEDDDDDDGEDGEAGGGGQQVEVMVDGNGANGLVVNVQLGGGGGAGQQEIQLQFGGMEGMQGPGAGGRQAEELSTDGSDASSMQDTDVLLHHVE